MQPLLFGKDSQFWFETLRALGHASYGGSDIGEVLTTARRITSEDYDSWYDAWSATATRLEDEGRSQLAAGHNVSAHDNLMRAATYYRCAEFFLRSELADERAATSYQSSVRCFQDALALAEPLVEPIAIPYENTTLNGYLYRSAEGVSAAPTLLIHSGFDGWAEEMHFTGALAAQQRGYTVISFDGPGQPGPRYKDKLVFRSDWENVITPVIDYAITLPAVDPQRIALCGNSMGGELAPRAAAFEHRLAALICVDGVYDFGAAYTMPLKLGDKATEVLHAGGETDLDSLLARAMTQNSRLRWTMRQGMWSFGKATPRAFLAATLDYNLRDGIAEKISCPVLVAKAESDEFFAGQPDLLMKHLTAPATLVTFTDAEGAGSHCHIGAQRLYLARILDWLDDTLSRSSD